MKQEDVRRVTNGLLVLEIVVNSITEDDLNELLRLDDSGRRAGLEQLPEYLFETPDEAMTVLFALKNFKTSVSNIKTYFQRRPVLDTKDPRQRYIGGPDGH